MPATHARRSALGAASVALLLITLLFVLGSGVMADDTTKRPTFPRQFFVSLGVTIPIPGVEPVAQSGQMYYDADAGRMRMDIFWLGNSRSFIADTRRRRGYLVSNDVCITSRLNGDLQPFAVPTHTALDADTHSVRGVPVFHYEGADGHNAIDFFVRQANFSTGSDDADATFWMPWRLVTRRLVRPELSPPSKQYPNWRYFGAPLMDEVVRYAGHSTALTRVVESVVVTTDFYNFVALRPDASIFTPPSHCKESVDAENEFAHNVDVHDAHRLLIELSFNSDQGVRLMGSLWGHLAAVDVGAEKEEL